MYMIVHERVRVYCSMLNLNVGYTHYVRSCVRTYYMGCVFAYVIAFCLSVYLYALCILFIHRRAFCMHALRAVVYVLCMIALSGCSFVLCMPIVRVHHWFVGLLSILTACGNLRIGCLLVCLCALGRFVLCMIAL